MTDDKERWIPTSEQQPKKNGKYIVTVDRCMGGKYVEFLDFALDLFKLDQFDFHDKKGVPGWYVYNGEWGYHEVDNVVAWMHYTLPEPYEQEKE